MKKFLLYYCIILICVLKLLHFDNSLAQKRSNDFLVTSLPIGKNVTIPPSIIVLLPITVNAHFAATDLPQSLKFSITTNNSTSSLSDTIDIAIYDKNAERVKYVKLKQNTSYLYNLISTDPVSIVPKISSKQSSLSNKIYIQIESNKPLHIKR